MKQKSIFIGSAVLLVVAFILSATFYKNQQSTQTAQLAQQNQVALNRAHAPTFGNPDAPVHIVENLSTPAPLLWQRYLAIIFDGLRPQGAHPLPQPAPQLP